MPIGAQGADEGGATLYPRHFARAIVAKPCPRISDAITEMLVKFILRWAKLAGEFCWPLATSVVARTGPDIKYIKKIQNLKFARFLFYWS